jgi:hypothetical protein
MEITIHIYHHILTGDMAALEAEIADLKARIVEEGVTPTDMATVDEMTVRAEGLAATEPPPVEPPLPTP